MTGRFEGDDNWRRWARNRSIHAALRVVVTRLRMVERSRLRALLPVWCPRRHALTRTRKTTRTAPIDARTTHIARFAGCRSQARVLSAGSIRNVRRRPPARRDERRERLRTCPAQRRSAARAARRQHATARRRSRLQRDETQPASRGPPFARRTSRDDETVGGAEAAVVPNAERRQAVALARARDRRRSGSAGHRAGVPRRLRRPRPELPLWTAAEIAFPAEWRRSRRRSPGPPPSISSSRSGR